MDWFWKLEVYELYVTVTEVICELNIMVINLLSLDLNTNNRMKLRIPVL